MGEARHSGTPPFREAGTQDIPKQRQEGRHSTNQELHAGVAITHENNETMHPAIPTECKAWSSLAGHKRKMPGQCKPGAACNRNCKLIPCVAIILGMSEELEAREAYAVQVQGGGRHLVLGGQHGGGKQYQEWDWALHTPVRT